MRFEEIADNIREPDQPSAADSAKYIGLEHMDTGSLHVRRWGSEADLKGQKLRMKKGDILFAKRNAYLRRVAIAPHDGFFSAHGMILRAKPETVLPEFLPFFMMGDKFMNRAVEISVGSLSPTINWSTLERQEFNLPPLDQQRRIAEILWAVDAQVNANLEVKSALEAYRKSLFGENLSSYTTKPLAEVADFLDGKRVPLSEKERAKRKGPYPYYGASGVIDSVDDFLFDEPLVLLSEDGFNLVNRTSRIAFRVEGKVWINNHAHVLRPKNGTNIDFLTDYLESISVEPYITGTYQRKLNKSECERIPIPYPPTDVQSDIASKISCIVQSLEAVDAHVAASKNFILSLLTNLTENQV
ncbi:MAG: restriction endonuclease subunit S [Verrucomicrobiota bacterium]